MRKKGDLRVPVWILLLAVLGMAGAVGYRIGAQAVAGECNVWIHEVRANIHELKVLFDKHRDAAH